MNVLHVIPSISEKHGGPTYALYAFARAAAQNGANVSIATTDDDGGNRRLDLPLGKFLERRSLKHIFFRRDFLPYKISFGLARWLNRNVAAYDIVHIHALFSFSSLAAARAARALRVPYVVRPLGVLNRWGMEHRRPVLKKLSFRSLELPILRHAAAIHYTAKAESDQAASLHAEIGGLPQFILPVPLEIETNTDSIADFGHRFPQAKGKEVILFLSRLDPKKGLETLLAAFATMKQRRPDLLLVIAGGGADTYVESIRALSTELAITSDVLWAGHLEGREKAAAFAAARVFVLPSYSENFGIAAAEAMAAGVPTVITKHVGLAEYAAARDAALITEATPQSVAAGVLALLNDAHLSRRLGDNGRQLVDEQFSMAAVGSKLHQLYGDIAMANRRRVP